MEFVKVIEALNFEWIFPKQGTDDLLLGSNLIVESVIM